MNDRDKIIDEMLGGFDFEKVHKVMEFLDWEWADSDEIPSIYRLIKTARDLLEEVWDKTKEIDNDNQYIATGGFRVACYYFPGIGKRLQLSFALETAVSI